MWHKGLSFPQLLRAEFWLMLQIGCSYGFTHTRNWAIFTVVQYSIFYSFCFSMIAVLMYTCCLVSDNIALLSQCLHFCIVGMVSMTASVVLTVNRNKVEAFHDFICDPRICEYAYSKYFEELHRNTLRKKNRLILKWAVFYGGCAFVGVSQPLIDKFFGASFDHANLNGAWVNLPVVMWFPFDIENSFVAWMAAYLMQAVFIIILAAMVISGIVLCFTTCDRILDQLRLIIHAVERLDNRAMALFKKKFPAGDERGMQEEYDQCYYECILQNVKHHHDIIKLFEDFMDLASIPIAVPFYGGAILLGMAMITITADDDPRMGPKCLAFALASAEAYNMYTLCEFGQKFKDKSLLLFNALFYTRWHSRSKACAKALMIVRYGCMKPLQMTAAKMLVLDMELFADLINSAYSIFNLQAASKE